MKKKRSPLILASMVLFLSGVLPAYAVIGVEEPPFEFVPDQLLVKFESGIDASGAEQIFFDIGAISFRIFPIDAQLYLVEFPKNTDIDRAIAFCRARSEIKYAEKNGIVRAAYIPNDPRFGELWGMHNTGQSGGKVDADIDAPEAWDITTAGPSVPLAVIDTGVDYNHPDLADNIWTNPGEICGNGIDDDSNGYADDCHGYDFHNNDGDPMDDNRHGTHVSGTIAAAGNNAIGVSGVVWSGKIMAVKFLSAGGSGTWENAVRAVDYATQMGAKISNNSWGGTGASQALQDAIERANQAGHLFVCAAGNSDNDIDASGDMVPYPGPQPFYPCSYANTNVLCAAAIDRNDQKASFSNYGKASVDLGAPGVDILSTLPGANYGTLSGTSMASPHTAGCAAILNGYNSTLSHPESKALLTETVRKTDAMTSITVSGGVVNARAALDASPLPNPPQNNKAPTANPGGPYRAKINVEKTFSGSKSSDPDGELVFYEWDFGDGTGKVIKVRNASVTHTYATKGTLTISLIVSDKYNVKSVPATTTCTVTGK